MPAYVALLRGIGPTDPKMRNDALRSVFERLGFVDVRTVISSGNVLFSTEDRAKVRLESTIEHAMLEHLDKPCTTILRTRSEITQVADLDVFDDYDDSPAQRCNVTFLKHRRSMSQTPPTSSPMERIVAVRDRAVFTVIDTTASKTPDLMRRLEKAYGAEITTRTWKTVHRVVAAFDR